MRSVGRFARSSVETMARKTWLAIGLALFRAITFKRACAVGSPSLDTEKLLPYAGLQGVTGSFTIRPGPHIQMVQPFRPSRPSVRSLMTRPNKLHKRQDFIRIAAAFGSWKLMKRPLHRFFTVFHLRETRRIGGFHSDVAVFRLRRTTSYLSSVRCKPPNSISKGVPYETAFT